MDSEKKEINFDELNSSDGREGKRALVAVEGTVYDVSNSQLWKGGSHMMRHRAGQDLTEDLSAAPHGIEKLEPLPRVGSLVQEKTGDPPSGLVKWILGFHPHPMSVHFPIAFSVATTVFVLLYLFTRREPFELTAFFLLVGACIMAPGSISTGAFSWWFSYGRKLTPIFKAKIALSMVLSAILLTAALFNTQILAFPLQPLGWLYLILTLLLAPTVMVLGYCGGRITFPR